jgi:LacI family transcriptional regulator
MTQLINLSTPPTAIIISGTVITLGVIKAITDQGWSIPKEISLIGFTDTMFSPYLVCAITTVSHQIEKIGKEAFKLLRKHIESQKPLAYTQIVVDMNFNLRESTQDISIFLEKVEH